MAASPSATRASNNMERSGTRRSDVTRLRDMGIWMAFVAFWAVFFLAMAVGHGTLDDIGRQYRDLSLVVQGIVWVLLLPLMIGLWICERPWSLPVRLLLVLAIGVWNIYIFFPRSL